MLEIWAWFATEKETIESARSASVNIEGGAGVKSDSLWEKILGLFATLKGEIGRGALAKVLTTRMEPSLFDSGQMERLIVASGGNLRDLFALTSYASDTAELRQSATIGSSDVQKAIGNLRDDYKRRLGASPYDPSTISYKDKADRLLRIYQDQPEDQMTDDALYSLLQSRAVQELVNGERWFGVHPLVVDILARQGVIAAGSGGVPGGTQ